MEVSPSSHGATKLRLSIVTGRKNWKKHHEACRSNFLIPAELHGLHMLHLDSSNSILSVAAFLSLKTHLTPEE